MYLSFQGILVGFIVESNANLNFLTCSISLCYGVPCLLLLVLSSLSVLCLTPQSLVPCLLKLNRSKLVNSTRQSFLLQKIVVEFLLIFCSCFCLLKISLKYEELRRQDKTWKNKTELERKDMWVDAALQVRLFEIFSLFYYRLILVQWESLNGITLVQRQIDTNKRMNFNVNYA